VEPRWMDTLPYLLNLTRHTPRDLLRLLEEIRVVEESGIFAPTGGPHLSRQVIREGVLQYSSRYFVGAIGNEFAGYENGTEGPQNAMHALQSMNHQLFDREQFAKALRQAGETRPEAV